MLNGPAGPGASRHKNTILVAPNDPPAFCLTRHLINIISGVFSRMVQRSYRLLIDERGRIHWSNPLELLGADLRCFQFHWDVFGLADRHTQRLRVMLRVSGRSDCRYKRCLWVEWCPWRESNPHSSRNTILSRARLPVPPHGHAALSIASQASDRKRKSAPSRPGHALGVACDGASGRPCLPVPSPATEIGGLPRGNVSGAAVGRP
jgi:hypothetical protein